MTRRPQIFLVHVMKTGGTSVGHLLRSQFDPASTYPNVRAGEGPDVKIFVDRLLALSAEQRSAIDYYSVHMPAWVAEHVAPGFTTVTVLREPVSRTISHLRHIARIEYAPDDLEEIYDDPGWHGRLTNYQTRLFAMSKQDYDDDREASRQFAEKADDETRRQLLIDMQQVWTTAITRPAELGESHLRRAIERLDRIHEVATTDTIDTLPDRLGRRTGLSLPPLEHVNAAGRAAPISPALEARIRRDNELDIAFYEYAAARVAAET